MRGVARVFFESVASGFASGVRRVDARMEQGLAEAEIVHYYSRPSPKRGGKFVGRGLQDSRVNRGKNVSFAP